MKIRFHHVLAFFVITLFFDFDYEIYGFRVRILDLFLVIVLGSMILSFKNLKIRQNLVAVSFYFFVLFTIINGFTKVPLRDVIKEGVQLIEYLFLMHLIANATDDEKKRKEFLNIL